MKWETTLMVFTMLFLTLTESVDSVFPKIIWNYWHQGFNSSRLFTRLCIQNKRRVAEANGWKFVMLDQQNLHEYLDTQRLQNIYRQVPQPTIQKWADIARLMLMIKYGGMWLDADAHFTRSLAWAEQPNSTQLIHNKIGLEPEVIIGAHSLNQTHYVYDQGLNMTILPDPILENWFLLAKPNSKFFNRWLQMLLETIDIGKDSMDQLLQEKGVKIYNLYFFVSNYLENGLLGLKQKELDQAGVGGYAVDDYDLWHTDGNQTGLQHLFAYSYGDRHGVITLWFDAITYSSEELFLSDTSLELGGEDTAPLFVKYIGWQSGRFNFFLQKHLRLNCWGMSHRFLPDSQVEKWLIRGLDQEPNLPQDMTRLATQIQLQHFCEKQISKTSTGTMLRLFSYYLLYLLLPGIAMAVYTCCCWCKQRKKLLGLRDFNEELNDFEAAGEEPQLSAR